MWRIDGAPREGTPDVGAFVATVNAESDLFDGGAPVFVSRAPGRLDLMGGIADYSGSLVLELPLAVATLVAAQWCGERSVTVRTVPSDGGGESREVSLPLTALAPAGVPIAYAAARALLSSDPSQRWAAYVLGALVVLGHECRVPITRGLRLLVQSSVPTGKGVSSSAALEVAAMQAVCAVYGVTLTARELALLCQRVENLVVGAPCGVMDQMTSAVGERDRLLALLCQPAELQAQVALPPELAVWGIDSGIRHAVTGAEYRAVRVGAFMGYRIIADLEGLSVTGGSNGRVQVTDARWHGYLANITPKEWEAKYRDAVPVSMDGAAFLARYRGTTDLVTHVDPERSYAVRLPTAHPIYENDRVQRFRTLLETARGGAGGEEQRVELGALMYQSHESYSACGLGSSGTDRLVELVRAAGPASGLYGAKITGGGSGGVVAVLARTGAEEIVHRIAREYTRDTGRKAMVLGGSSPGASAFGTITLRH